MRNARSTPTGGLWVGLLSLVAFASLAVSMTAHGSPTGTTSATVASIEGAAPAAADPPAVAADPPAVRDGDGDGNGGGGGGRGGRGRR